MLPTRHARVAGALYLVIIVAGIAGPWDQQIGTKASLNWGFEWS